MVPNNRLLWRRFHPSGRTAPRLSSPIVNDCRYFPPRSAQRRTPRPPGNPASPNIPMARRCRPRPCHQRRRFFPRYWRPLCRFHRYRRPPCPPLPVVESDPSPPVPVSPLPVVPPLVPAAEVDFPHCTSSVQAKRLPHKKGKYGYALGPIRPTPCPPSMLPLYNACPDCSLPRLQHNLSRGLL